jgi:hypothetical protein
MRGNILFDLTDGLFFHFFLVPFIYNFKNLLILFVLHRPKEFLVELRKLFKHGSVPYILAVFLSNLNDRIYDPHYEFRIILIFPGLFVLKVVTDFDFVCEEEIVFFIIDSANLTDDFPHSRCASCWRSLRV